MRFLSGRCLMLAALTILAALLISCSDDNGEPAAATAAATEAAETQAEGSTINVAITEWAIVPDEEHAYSAGEVTFEATNSGAAPHEFVVIRTDLAPDALPVAAGLVDESQVEVIGRMPQVPAGESATLRVSLETGNYALICNIPAHYGLGMLVAFTVD